MTDISLEAVTGKFNRVGYDAFIQALRQAKSAGNRNVELAHWLFHTLQDERTDLSLSADHYKLDRARLLSDLAGVISGFRKNETDMPGVANTVIDMLDRGWHYATLFFGETQIRTGHLLVAGLKSTDLRRALTNLSPEFGKINVDVLTRRIPRDLGRFRRREPAPDGWLRRSRRRYAGRRPGSGAERHDTARPVFAGSDGEGEVRRDGSDPRPRRRDPSVDRRPDAPAPEQPDPHRRGRRRQDRRGRGLCPAHRIGRRSAAAARMCGSARSTSA